jgi:hypothetical protein
MSESKYCAHGVWVGRTCDWCEDIKELTANIDALKAELNEQARLNGMGSEREAKLMAENERLIGELEELKDSIIGYVWNFERERGCDPCSNNSANLAELRAAVGDT